MVSNFSTVKVVQLGSPSWVRSVLQLVPGWFVPLVPSAYPKQFGTRSPAERSFVVAVHSFDSFYLYALCWKRIKIVHFSLIYNNFGINRALARTLNRWGRGVGC